MDVRIGDSIVASCDSLSGSLTVQFSEANMFLRFKTFRDGSTSIVDDQFTKQLFPEMMVA